MSLKKKREREKGREDRILKEKETRKLNKPQKKSLRFLAPVNLPTDSSTPETNTITQNRSLNNSPQTRKNTPQSRKSNSRGGRNNYRKQFNSNNRKGGGLKYKQKSNENDNQDDQDNSQEDKDDREKIDDQDNGEESDDELELPDFEGNYTENNQQYDNRKYRVSIFNRESKEENVYSFSEQELNEYFPPNIRKARLIYN